MGKPKKATKDHEDSDNDEVATTEHAGENDTESQSTTQPSTKAERKKKNKKGKQKDDDWDDIESELQSMTLEANKGNEDIEESAPIVSKKTKTKTKGVSAFALLANMDDGGDDDLSDKKSDDDDDDKEVKMKEESVPAQKSKKKEKAKKEKAKKQDEDIDAILADIEKSGKGDKKKKKKNKGDVEEDNNEEESEAPPVPDVVKMESIDDLADELEEEKKKKKKKKKGKDEEAQEGENEEADGEAGEDGVTMKSAAQKKKEKKEREKQKKLEEKQKQFKKDQAKKEKEGSAEGDKPKEEAQTTAKEPKKKEDAANKEKEAAPNATQETTPEAGEGGEGEGSKEKEGKKKKKKKGDKEKEEKPEEKSKPKNKQLAALKEALRIQKEEEALAIKEAERRRLEEEESIRRLEEELKRKEEIKRLKKIAKKEKEAQLKREGKFLTEKQKQDKRKVEQMLEAMKLSGVEFGPRPSAEGTSKRGMVYGKKKKPSGNKEKSPSTVTSPTEEGPVIEGKEDSKKEVKATAENKKEVKEGVKDEWDAESADEEEEEEEEDSQPEKSPTPTSTKPQAGKGKEEEEEEEEEEEDEEDDDDEDDDEDEDDSSEESESESDSEEEKTPIDRGRDKIHKRADKAEKARTLDKLRAPVVCVLGHVDTGKTKILDKLRRTNVQDGEAGGITQQIGATNVPKDAVVEKTKMIKEFSKQELKIPGLLIIDTPGHESFSNLRLRGSSLCDIAILVIDIMHGLEPQTIESINLLKERKTPFLVALNKIDRLYQWKPQPMTDVQNTLKKQSPHTKAEFDERAQQAIIQLAEEGLNAALFYENKNPREYVSLVPTSAHTGDGMGNLVALVCELCQSLLAKRLMYCTELQATVMEVKAITGMGTTIDVILINGSLNEGDSIVIAGTEGPIVTQIRGLLMPQPMKELRVKNQYDHHKTVMAAQGVKINAKDMEKALAGLPLFVARDNDEREYYKDEVALVLKDTLDSIKVQDRGVFVQASTLGSMEALLEFLRTSKIPYAGINIGPVHKKDIMRASVMLEHDSQYAVILAFDVKVEREAQDLADNLGVRIFTAEIIYHLFDAFIKYRDDLKKQKQEEFKNIAVFPCKLRVLPQYIFNSRDPIVMGVIVEAGFLKEGTPICVPTKEFVDIGRVGSLELNHKQVDIARQGQEVCIKIVPSPGEAPKMYGRHFEDTDMLVSKISRPSIDAVKDYFREEMTKPDWKLMVELKKQFKIL